ncbi:MAG TPA: 3-keto-5-aminohexanoate cleavage protein [Burkholderiales bacterium]|nr:3-keto-5-aminohexanoate cleavage protein [Burkholderiales bacterium]
MLEQALKKTWIEAALNGPWSRGRQPDAPLSVDELVEQGIACAKAGAAIIHVHAYDESTGRPSDDAQTYARIIEGIRRKVDAIVYPAVPAAGLPGSSELRTPEQRYAHVEQLAGRGLLEWTAVDPGSVDIAHYDDLRDDKPGFMLLNPEQHIRHALRLARHLHLHPSYGIFEPGFIRMGATLHWRESAPAPVYRFMFSRGFTFSFPPEDYGLTAYLKLLDQAAPGARWMVAGLDVDVMPMIPRILVEGGHLRVGLEDAPFGCEKSNVQLVEEAAAAISRSGGEIAGAQDVRMSVSPEQFEAA